MIKVKFTLVPKENQKDAALLYFADRLGMNVRDYIYQAAQEKTADLAKILEAEIKKAQQVDKESGSDIAGSLQTTESQSVQSSGASEQETVDDTRSESSEG